MAVIPIPSGASLRVPESAFRDWSRVRVQVLRGSEPVPSAVVTLRNNNRSQEVLLDPDSEGEAVFYGIRGNTVKIEVQTNVDGKPAPLIRQDAEIPPNGVITIGVPGARADASTTGTGGADGPADTKEDQKTTDPAATGSTKKGEGTAQEPGPGGFINYLIGLALVAAAAYFALQYYKNNKAIVDSKLESVGVQVPKPLDADPAVPDYVPATKQNTRPDPILLGDAGVTPIDQGASAVAGVASVTVSGGKPALRSASGDVLDLADGTLVLGRDVAVDVSLPSETTLSRRHAEIITSGATVTLRDLGSTNGTFVNGHRISSDTTLRPGDRVQFGAVAFTYEVT